MNSVSPVAKNS